MKKSACKVPLSHPDRAAGLAENGNQLLIAAEDGASYDWSDTAQRLVEAFRRSNIPLTGVAIEGVGWEDNAAFLGPYVSPGEYIGEDPPLSVSVYTRSDQPVRHISNFVIGEERLAEIADGYVLPEHLKAPTNPVEAAISYFVSKVAGINYDFSKDYSDMALEARGSQIKDTDLNFAQKLAAANDGGLALGSAHENALYRASKLEALEHVLRFFLYRECARPQGNRPFNITCATDYSNCSGVLGEALAVINGSSYFPKTYEENDGLRMGLLPSKKRFVVTYDGFFVEGVGQQTEPEPIWPASKATEYRARKEQEKQQAAARLATEREVTNARLSLERQEAAARAEAEAQPLLTRIEELRQEGYVWRGVMSFTGRCETEEGLREYLELTYPGQDVQIVRGCAVYGGTRVTVTSDSFTVYVKG